MPSPYYNERPVGAEIDTLVLHCSAYSAPDMIEILHEKELSAHYIIGTEGEIYQTVDENKRAWHAGISEWRGKKNLNHTSIGIEISSPSLGQENYSEKQIISVIELCRDIISRHNISPKNVLAHSDIAPTRKADPNFCFPWQTLAKNGIGIWYNLNNSGNINLNNSLKLLKKIGYNINNPAAAKYAFCRHFVPDIIEKAEIKQLEKCPYPKNFRFPSRYLPILKACAAAYND